MITLPNPKDSLPPTEKLSSGTVNVLNYGASVAGSGIPALSA